MNQFTTEAKREVLRLLQEGKKLEAIKYLNDNFGTSLAESKMLVETLEKETGTEQGPTSPLEINPELSRDKLSDSLKAEVVTMLRANQKMEAIKFVRQNLGIGLKDGLILVEEVEKEINPNYRSVKIGGGCLSGSFKVASFIFGFMAVLLIGIGIIIYLMQENIISDGERVKGEVVDFRTMDRGTAPVISYQLNGHSKTYESTLYSTPPDYELHETVWLFVSRSDPDDVLIDNFSERWLAITVLAIIAAVFIFFTVLFRFIARKF